MIERIEQPSSIPILSTQVVEDTAINIDHDKNKYETPERLKALKMSIDPLDESKNYGSEKIVAKISRLSEAKSVFDPFQNSEKSLKKLDEDKNN